MENITFTHAAAPADPNSIQAVEQEYDIVLPDDYKAHLLKYNGGYPSKDAFITDDKHLYRVAKFKSAGGGKGSLEMGLEMLSDQFHSDLIPFATETGGDVFVLSVGPEDYGSVYYVAHESYRPPAFLEEEGAEPTPRDYGQGVYFLAPSFTAFLEGLVEKSLE